MAVAFGSIGVTKLNTSRSNTITVANAASVSVGDFLVMVLGNCGPAVYTLLNGWQSVDGSAGAGEAQSDVFVKFADASDVAASQYTLTYTSSNASFFANWGVVIRYTGVVSARAMRTFGASAIGTTSPALPTPPGTDLIPAATGTELVVGIYSYGSDATGTGQTLTYPGTGSWTQRVKAGPTSIASTFNGGCMVVEKFGATDTPTATSSATGGWVSTILILSPNAATNPSPRQNLCTNPGLSVNSTGWTTLGSQNTGARTTGSGFLNPNVFRMTLTSTPPAANNNSILSPKLTAAAGDVWAGSCEIASSVAGRLVLVKLRFENGSGTELATATTLIKLSTLTTPQTVLFFGQLAPATTAVTCIELLVPAYDAVNGTTYDITSVMMEKIYQEQPYFDGNSRGWNWTGAAGNTTSIEFADIIKPVNRARFRAACW